MTLFRSEVSPPTGAPWTLAAYSVEGGHSKLATKIKTLCLENPALAHALLDKFTRSLCVYASFQVPLSTPSSLSFRLTCFSADLMWGTSFAAV